MNKVSFYFILSLITLGLFSCNGDDNAGSTKPPKPFAEQYPIDIDSIENYLKTHSFSVVDVEGRIDVEIDTFIAGNTAGKVSIWDNTDYPLQHKMVRSDIRLSNLVGGQTADTLDYKMYYLIINQGGGAAATRFDSTFVSYRGWRLDNKQFDVNPTPFWVTFPQITTLERSLITGFRQFTALLNASESIVPGTGGGPITYNNYGVGVVFLPSGLGYYNSPQPNLPSFSPLAFTVRLHALRQRDHDRDGVMSKFENGNGTEDLYTVDTDSDKVPDFLDLDDDGDNVRTILEVRNPLTGKPFPYAEIPTCVGGTVKKHVDSSCQ